MSCFQPLFKNPHVQTLAGHFWKRPPEPAPLESELFEAEPGVRVLVQSQYPAGARRGDVVLVHGMEGSGSSGYIRSMAFAAFHGGFAEHRFHMRTCGGTERMSPTLYHGGLTSDLIAVLREFRVRGSGPVFLAGYSLGGNVALKMVGELGEAASELLRGVCAVSAPIDLEAAALRIGQWQNRIYERRFVRRMRARLCATGRYAESDFRGLRSLRAIDDKITAPSFQFGTALNYYRSQSATHYLSGIRIPALLVQAKDDPFIPFQTFALSPISQNSWIELNAPEHGGHLGFISRNGNRFWADSVIMSWISKIAAIE
jgi:predicted alpha/beta-fold hydrolase